ncbi:190_t:CDS:2 [Gigaspora margarita]|uniref:190_t:CDS:1 n=1 Tax=Gigaspora margarita TaxID=4874 RepID=A0ABN7UNB3_GIGMA|nr:190_t:CDS:2 [Gigaspora margarita]
MNAKGSESLLSEQTDPTNFAKNKDKKLPNLESRYQEIENMEDDYIYDI